MEGGLVVGFDTWDALITENSAFQRISEPSKIGGFPVPRSLFPSAPP
jgi:hypothetical protein